MRVSLLVDSTLYPLAGTEGVSERVHSSVSDFRHEAEIALQPMPKVRADHSYDQDRKNLKTTVAFSTTRLFETAEAAFLYDLDYDRIYPRSGTLVIMPVAVSGEVSVRHLLNAVVKPPSRRVIGCTVMLSYSVTGSEIIFISDAGIPATALLGEDGEPLLAEDDGNLLTEE